MKSKQYWLMKTEPDVFSIDDLKKNKTTLWEGVRNYQARNYMMNDMKVGDIALLYHSNATPPGVAGIMKVSAAAIPDPLQFDKKSEYYDKKATRDKPRWYCVECTFVKKFPKLVTLDELRANIALSNMVTLRKGNRLSITPLSQLEYEAIVENI
jgi:predicted RNA-binding protein with PUA-like domain